MASLSIQKVLLAASTFLLLSISSPVKALPGDTMNLAVNRLRNSPFLRGIALRQERLGPFTFYDASFQYGRTAARVSLKSPDLRWEDSITATLSVLGGVSRNFLGSRIIEESYNLREDEEFIELLQGVWGEAVAQDFVASRFTDRRREVTDEFRTAYKGQQFGYIAALHCSQVGCTLHFHILSHHDWEFRRLPYTL